MLLMYSSYSTSVYGSRDWVFGDRVSVGVEICKIVFLGALVVYLFKRFWCRMYSLATIHFVTDRQTDRQTDGQMNCVIPIADILLAAVRSAKNIICYLNISNH